VFLNDAASKLAIDLIGQQTQQAHRFRIRQVQGPAEERKLDRTRHGNSLEKRFPSSVKGHAIFPARPGQSGTGALARVQCKERETPALSPSKAGQASVPKQVSPACKGRAFRGRNVAYQANNKGREDGLMLFTFYSEISCGSLGFHVHCR